LPMNLHQQSLYWLALTYLIQESMACFFNKVKHILKSFVAAIIGIRDFQGIKVRGETEE